MLFLGIGAALVILTSRSLYYAHSQDNQAGTEEVKRHAEPEDGEGQEQLTIAEDAIASIVPLSVSHVLHFIADIFLPEKDKLNVEVDTTPELTTYFKTLFRRIISPNAP